MKMMKVYLKKTKLAFIFVPVSRLTYMKGRTAGCWGDGRTDLHMYVGMVDDVMAIKPNFLTWMGYQYFLSYGAPRTRALSSAIDTNVESSCFGFCLGFFAFVWLFLGLSF